MGGKEVFSVLTEPVKGAKKDGARGFFGGLLKGAVHTVVKPVTRVAQAVEDVTSGIGAEISTEGKVLGTNVPELHYRKRTPR